jgi:glycosyltransferase involved in cell wall biosynthesis
VVVDLRNQEALAKAMVGLIDNPLKSSKLGKNARETIVRTYSYEMVGEQLFKIYNSLLN